MNKLILEFFNNRVKAYVVSKDYAVLMSKTYITRGDWGQKIAADVALVDPTLKKYSMSFVQTSTTVKTVKQNIQITNFNANHIKEQIMKEIRQTNISSEITGFIFNHKQLRPGKYEINYIYELVSKEIIKSKRIALASADFIWDGEVHSATKAFIRELRKSNKKMTVQLHVEEDSIMTLVQEGKEIITIEKKPYGLSVVYQQIADKMGISLEQAKSFFKNFGNIPPERVRDNKVIWTSLNEEGIRTTFTKKDLSGYVTNYVDQLIEYMKKDFGMFIEVDTKVIMSGDITILNGLIEYTEQKLGILDVEIYESKIFGFHDQNTVNMNGIIQLIKDRAERDRRELQAQKQLEKRNNVFKTMFNKLRGEV